MTQLNFTLDMDKLTEEILSSNLNSATKGLAVAVFNAYMEAERDAYVQADSRERHALRQDMRNGYYERDYKLPIGRITLKVPRTRSGAFSTKLFEKYQRMDQSLVLTLVESVVSGVSTRKVTKIVETLCGEGVSRSFASDILKRLDPEVATFRERALHHKYYAYVYVDALYIKVRENHRVVSKGVYIAQGVTSEKRREIIGFMVSEEESKASWTRFFQDLRARGLKKPKLIISDAHSGLKAAIKEDFLNCPWQRCTTHFLRNLTDVMPKKNSQAERTALKQIFYADTLAHARELKTNFIKTVEGNPKYTAVIEKLEAGFDDALQFIQEPTGYHVSLRTTNSLERVNREIRRRERVIGIFPNIDSAVRLIGAVLMDIHEGFQKTKRKFLRDYAPGEN